MEQTMVDSFFQAQKKNNFHSNPAKRRKLLDKTSMDMHFVKEKVIAQKPRAKSTGRKSRAQSQKSKGCNGISISALLNAKPMESTEVTSNKDQHSEILKRKVSSKSISKEAAPKDIRRAAPAAVEVANTAPDQVKQTELLENRKRGLKIDPWIASQSKAVLEQRKLQQNKHDTAQHNETVRSSKAPVVQQNEKKTEAVPNCDSSTSRKAKNPRSSLRQKYAHLLAKPVETVQEAPTAEKEATCVGEPRVPAHQRLKSLAAAEPLPFAIPSKYKTLMEQFKCADSILFLLEQRSEACTFEKLKKSVENMSGRNFGLKHLAQFKKVYPDAFTFRQEKSLRKANGSVFNGYQLTVQANFSNVALKKLDVGSDGKAKLSPTVLVTRRANFESNLIKIVWKHHLKFLHQMNINVREKEIKRWHSKFDLENVPDIEEAELPKAPLVNKVTSAGDILSHASKKLIPQVASAMGKIASQGEKSSMSSNVCEKELNSKNKQETGNKLMAGVSQSLLERIREKEQRKNELAMTRNPEQEKELAMMERLPEMARILKTYFTTEKKNAIAVEDCAQKLTQSYGTAISSASLSEHLTLLAKLVPSWMKIVAVRKCPYVKLVKNTDINYIHQELATKKKEALDK